MPAPPLPSSSSWTSCGPVTGRLEVDRLGRSLRHLVDTITPGGKLVFHVFAALAEFERDLIRERTSAGWPQPGPGVAAAAGRRC